MRRPQPRPLLALACAGHVLLAALAWSSATERGSASPATGALGLALTASTLAVAVVLASWVSSRRGARAGWIALAAAVLALPAHGVLLARLGAAEHCYESSSVSGVLFSTDRAWRVNIRICEPYRRHSFARIDLTRVTDRRRWTVPVEVRRSPRDVISRSERWARLEPVGDGVYWLSLSTAVARKGPQFFSVDTRVEPPELSEINRGLELVDGLARWSCAVWLPRLPPDPLASVCGENAGLPPARQCAMEWLAADCDERLATAAGCRPALAVAPEVTACLDRRAVAGDLAAQDALFLVALAAELPVAAESAIAEARAADRDERAECAEARDAARRLVAARRLGRSGPQREAAVELLRLRRNADIETCRSGLPQLAQPLGAAEAQLEWEIVAIDRQWGFVDRSCRGALALVERERQPGGLSEWAASELQAWAAACRDRRARVTAGAP